MVQQDIANQNKPWRPAVAHKSEALVLSQEGAKPAMARLLGLQFRICYKKGSQIAPQMLCPVWRRNLVVMLYPLFNRHGCKRFSIHM
jgi:hypothetical protein